MSDPPHQSQVEDENIITDPNLSPSTLEKHSDALSTMAKNFQETNKEKYKRNLRDSSLSCLFLQVKNTKIIITNKDYTKQITVH